MNCGMAPMPDKRQAVAAEAIAQMERTLRELIAIFEGGIVFEGDSLGRRSDADPSCWNGDQTATLGSQRKDRHLAGDFANAQVTKSILP
jgi:hypothetical protein